MKRIIALFMLVSVAGAGTVQADSRPDFTLKCQNGKYAKVWFQNLRVENNCASHSKEWLEIAVFAEDEDVVLINVAAGAKYKQVSTPQKMNVRLGRGTFCYADNYIYLDINEFRTVYAPGSTWRAPVCDG